MKLIFKILSICIWLILPLSVNADTCDADNCSACNDQTSCEQNSNHGVCKWENNACTERCPATTEGSCNQTPGCGHNGVECVPCNPNEYNPGGSIATGCKTCATKPDDVWMWDNSNASTHPDYSVFDYDNAEYGQSSCPWKCDDGYYKNNDGDACLHCPLKPSDTDYGNDNTLYAMIQTHENQTNISQCDCGTGIDLIKMKKPIPGQQTSPLNAQYDRLYFCGTCGTAKSNHTTPEECGNVEQTRSNPAYGEEFDNGIRMAYKCPDHATYNEASQQCVCTSPTGAASADMECDYLSNTNTPCSCSLTCDESKHLIPSGNSYACHCDYDYYGNAINGCTRCPAGTVTYQLNTGIHYPGATVISECKMLHGSNTAYDVQFCTSDGNCMDLIPSNATIIQPQ